MTKDFTLLVRSRKQNFLVLWRHADDPSPSTSSAASDSPAAPLKSTSLAQKHPATVSIYSVRRKKGHKNIAIEGIDHFAIIITLLDC